MTPAKELVRLIHAYFDERFAIVAAALDHDLEARLALAEMRQTLPDVMHILEQTVDLARMVGDAVAVMEEHTA